MSEFRVYYGELSHDYQDEHSPRYGEFYAINDVDGVLAAARTEIARLKALCDDFIRAGVLDTSVAIHRYEKAEDEIKQLRLALKNTDDQVYQELLAVRKDASAQFNRAQRAEDELSNARVELNRFRTQHVELNISLRRILGSRYDGVTPERIAKELVNAREQLADLENDLAGARTEITQLTKDNEHLHCANQGLHHYRLCSQNISTGPHNHPIECTRCRAERAEAALAELQECMREQQEKLD